MDPSLIAGDVQETTKKKATRKRKSSDPKNQPLKVVYISNPMRVQTSAAEFRALVQELTGRDADFPDPTKFPSPSVHALETDPPKKPEEEDDDNDNDDELLLLDLAAMEDSSSDDFLEGSYGTLEDIFTRDMVEKLAAWL